MAVHKAVVPAAGLGTRFLPATKAQPKEMLVLVDKPAIQYIVEEGVAAGVRNFLVVTGRNKKSLEDHFDRAPELEAALRQKGEWELLATVEETARLAAVHYVRQPEARGLGDAVACAAAFVGDEDFAVLLPDDLILADPPCLAQMLAVKEAYGGAVVALEEVEPAQTQRYGIIRGREIDRGVWRIDDLVEKPTPAEAPSHLAVVGRYLLPGRLFPILAATPPGAGGEIQLTDALRVLARDYPLYGYLFTGRRFDVGD
ncbi:MAG: UTP--glucose-1-phosphate uridylyltransferase GalU, partial [Clostridia bacterium]|nr:UTP--glucose-1-phosphate uridylyltransferase GalU [Clostridia bacterium]